MTVRILLVDDHEFMRMGLRQTLSKDPQMEIVGEAGDGVQAVALAQERRPDIVLMDIQMPGLNGIEATKRIVREVPEAKVVMMTMYKEESQELAALRVGALGYVHKDSNPDDLLRAVRAVANGDAFLTPQSTRRVLSEFQWTGDNGHYSTKSELLTEREKALLRYVAQGLSAKQMASELALSAARVRTLLSELYAKLGVNGKAQAAAYAAEHKLI